MSLEIEKEPSIASSKANSDSDASDNEAKNGAVSTFIKQINDISRITTATFDTTDSFEPLKIADYNLFKEKYGNLALPDLMKNIFN